MGRKGRRQGVGQVGLSDPPAETGWAFSIERRYVARAQAGAFQAILDRLQSLNLIAWAREPDTIRITVASDSSRAAIP